MKERGRNTEGRGHGLILSYYADILGDGGKQQVDT
jgi:hypothetical protein